MDQKMLHASRYWLTRSASAAIFSALLRPPPATKARCYFIFFHLQSARLGRALFVPVLFSAINEQICARVCSPGLVMRLVVEGVEWCGASPAFCCAL